MTRPNPYADARPGSLASTIRLDAPEGCRIALLGLPDDTGVRLNHGRPGARDGPRAFRAALSRYGAASFIDPSTGRITDLSAIGVFDAGEVEPAASIEETHERITARVTELLELDLLPICIGGGHDLTWPAVRAVAARFPEIAGVYFDAHLDVREETGSGMPFRKILTETSCCELTIVGMDGFANQREHFEWFTAHGGRTAGTVTEIAPPVQQGAAHWFVSFDLDVINVAHAPGVSAINPLGIGAERAAGFAQWSGSLDEVRYFDIMELNPAFDIDGRTARLAVRLFLSFLRGFASRHAAV